LCNLVTAQSANFEVTQNSRVLQFASFSFDAATSEWGMALTQGATLCLITQPLMADIAALEDEVQRLAISHVTLPPALLPSLTQAKWASVSHLVVAGDHCSLALAQTWSQGRNFYNAYGPSEATVCSNISRFDAEQNTLSIGKFINNVQGYVLDNQQQLCVIGAIGELHLGGVGLARGYLNRDELTQDKFTHNPFSDDVDARLYKTGDLVRWLPDGNLQFLGRIDHQVKIRGFRIELGEIEAAITSSIVTSSTVTSSTVANQTLTQITEAVVVAIDEPKRVVAYIVAADSIALSDSEKEKLVDALRTELNHKLPDYMMPSAFMVLEALPLTSNGKLDRKALPTPEVMQYQTAYVAPRTELEITLCQIWQEVLGVEQVGMTDNFFHLGGHSLLVVKLLAELKKSLDLNLQVKDLFGFAVLSEMSAYIEEVLLLNKNNQLKEQSDTEMEIEW